jgi:hypothetical protein
MQKILSVMAILALAAALSPAAFAQPQQSSPVQASSAPDPAQDSFTGTVVKAKDRYVLKTDAGTYQLDNQDKAKQFENQQVKVSGNLDKSSGVIHITDIQPAAQQ